MPTSDDRRDGPGRRDRDDLALAVARIETILQNVAQDTQETKQVSADGFAQINGRLRRLEAWREAQEAVAAAVATQQASAVLAQRDHRSAAQKWHLALMTGGTTLVGVLLGHVL